jgi:hypothetical protein
MVADDSLHHLRDQFVPTNFHQLLMQWRGLLDNDKHHDPTIITLAWIGGKGSDFPAQIPTGPSANGTQPFNAIGIVFIEKRQILRRGLKASSYLL